MLVANPIYDSVFKFLMDDEQAAKILIGNILGVNVLALRLDPTETAIKNEAKDFNIYRIDFKATITEADGSQRVVLIELQKAKLESDILRFRRYLGNEYRNKNNIYEDASSHALPIFPIYILGHTLLHCQQYPIINVKRSYYDNYSGSEITLREAFIESLSHDSIVIQVPLLKHYRRNKLERLLSIFDASSKHEVEVSETADEDAQLIARRLLIANSDEQLRRQMEVEDDILSEMASKDRLVQIAREETQEAIKLKEEAIKLKEEAIRLLLATGMAPSLIAEKMNLPITEVERLK